MMDSKAFCAKSPTVAWSSRALSMNLGRGAMEDNATTMWLL